METLLYVCAGRDIDRIAGRHRIDRFEIFGDTGSYKYQINTPYICIDENESQFGGSDVIIGTNFFKDTQILIDGPARKLGFYVGLEDFLYSTIETEIIFDVEAGRVNEIVISPGTPGFPPLDPNEADVVLGNVVFYWNIMMDPNSDRAAQNIRLWLFERIPNTANPSMTPPSYQGRRPGEFLLRYPNGDDTFSVKEDTPLWIDYIATSWQPVTGAHVTVSNLDEERENSHPMM